MSYKINYRVAGNNNSIILILAVKQCKYFNYRTLVTLKW